MQITTYEGPKLRLVWVDLTRQDAEPNKGTFLFDVPAEARGTKRAMLKQFPNCEVYLEDRAGNKIELPLT